MGLTEEERFRFDLTGFPDTPGYPYAGGDYPGLEIRYTISGTMRNHCSQNIALCRVVRRVY